MDATELKNAIKESSRIIAFVSLVQDSKKKTGIRLSKAAATRMVNLVPLDTETTAEWCDQDAGILFIG